MGKLSTRFFPIPGYWDPCPGKMYATVIADFRLPIADLQLSMTASNFDERLFQSMRRSYRTNRQLAIGNRQCVHQRISTAPQVTPPPNEAINTRSPSLIRPSSTHSSSPIGIEADEVLPCCAIPE